MNACLSLRAVLTLDSRLPAPHCLNGFARGAQALLTWNFYFLRNYEKAVPERELEESLPPTTKPMQTQELCTAVHKNIYLCCQRTLNPDYLFPPSRNWFPGTLAWLCVNTGRSASTHWEEKAARKSNGHKWLRGAVLLIPVSVLAGYPALAGSNHQSYTLFFLFSAHLLSPWTDLLP